MPLWVGLSFEQQDRIVDVLRNALGSEVRKYSVRPSGR
jgi:hypothetical protein